MSLIALDLSYATAQLRLAQMARPAWIVESWEWRCRELASRLLDTELA